MCINMLSFPHKPMPPSFLSDDKAEAQRIYDRGVYAGLILMFWAVFFLEFRYPIVGFIVSTCLSAFLMMLYMPLLRFARRIVERKIQNIALRTSILCFATIIYEALPLYALRHTAPLWMMIVLFIIMSLYNGYIFLKENVNVKRIL